MDYTISELEAAFLDFMREVGLPPADFSELAFDGRKHRYSIDGADRKAKNKHGEMKVYPDEWPSGYVHDYKNDLHYTWSMYKKGEHRRTEFDDEEYRKKRREEQEKRSAEEKAEKAEAVRNAARKWDAATAPKEGAGLHPYLKRKGLRGYYGAKVLDKKIVIPIRSVSGALMSVQTIDSDGAKMFVKHAPMRGGFFALERGGDTSGRVKPEAAGSNMIFLAEGFATAATIHEATGLRVLVCFDCHNMVTVADDVRRSGYIGRVIIAADNDRGSEGNPGLSAAEKIREEFGYVYVYPDFADGEKGTDWNDYAQIHGLDATRDVLREKVREALSAAPPFDRKPRWLDVKKSGAPLDTIGNFAVLTDYEGVGIRYNLLSKEQEIILPKDVMSDIRGGDNTQNAAYSWLQSKMTLCGMADKHLRDYVVYAAERDMYHPVREWLEGVKWDGETRIDKLMRTLTCPESFDRYLLYVFLKRWLVSAAAAVFSDDGFYCRGVFVLQGPQGIGKTSWFRNLVPKERHGWFIDGVTLDVNDKDSIKRCISHWIVELGEVEATFKKSDINRLKSFITQSEDKIRMPWGRDISSFQRRTVFCASVNDLQYLQDTTGNSRWWTVPCISIKYDHGIDLAQLWAEALHLYRSGERWWLGEDEERSLTRSNKTFESADSIVDCIGRGLDWEGFDPKDNGGTWMTATEVLVMLDYNKRGVNNAHVRRAVQVLREYGAPERRIGHKGSRCFYVPPKRNVGLYSGDNIYSSDESLTG